MDLDRFNPIPVVQVKKKYANFTLREVSYREILEFREKEKLKEDLLKMKAQARDQRIAIFESETNQKLDTPIIKKEAWSDKLAALKAERRRLAKLEDQVTQYVPSEPAPEPKKTLFQRVIMFFVKLCKVANF